MSNSRFLNWRYLYLAIIHGDVVYVGITRNLITRKKAHEFGGKIKEYVDANSISFSKVVFVHFACCTRLDSYREESEMIRVLSKQGLNVLNKKKDAKSGNNFYCRQKESPY